MRTSSNRLDVPVSPNKAHGLAKMLLTLNIPGLVSFYTSQEAADGARSPLI